jgi:hypothetical protein
MYYEYDEDHTDFSGYWIEELDGFDHLMINITHYDFVHTG